MKGQAKRDAQTVQISTWVLAVALGFAGFVALFSLNIGQFEFLLVALLALFLGYCSTRRR